MTDRLPRRPGEVIDRDRPVTFRFNGKALSALTGDSVATALHANGVRVMATSFKYHRPRGLMELGVHAADPMMTVDGRPNTRIARTPVRDGMTVEGQFKTGLDVYKLADMASSAMQVGFYYKNPAFYKSRPVWNKARDMMRTAPGNLGEIKPLAHGPGIDEATLTPDLLVIGGGLAGMEAALTGAAAGVRVVLVEAEPWLGGHQAFQGPDGREMTRPLADRVRSTDTITVLTRATAAMAYPDGLFVCIQGCGPEEPFLERSWLIRPRAVVFATGAMDRPLIFEHNDRPGILFPQTAQRLVHLYALAPGTRVLLAGGDAALYRTARDLLDAGGARGRPGRQPAPWRARALGQGGLRSRGACLGRKRHPGSPGTEGSGRRDHHRAGRRAKNRFRGRHCRRLRPARPCSSSLPRPAPGSSTIPGWACTGSRTRRPGMPWPAASTAWRTRTPSAPRAGWPRRPGAGPPGSGSETRGRRGSRSPGRSPGPAAQPVPEPGRHGRRPAVHMPGQRCHGKGYRPGPGRGVQSPGNDQAVHHRGHGAGTRCPDPGRSPGLPGLAEPRGHGRPRDIHPAPAPHRRLHGRPGRRPPRHAPAGRPLHEVQTARGGVTVRSGPWLRVNHFGDPEKESLAVHHAAALLDVSTLGKFRLFGPDAAQWYDRA